MTAIDDNKHDCNNNAAIIIDNNQNNETSSAVNKTVSAKVGMVATNNLPYPDNNNETFNVYISMFLRDNPKATKIQSTGYPEPFPILYNETWRYSVCWLNLI